MRLILRVLSFNGKQPYQAQESNYESFPVVIGRSSSCDFILDDPSKYVSSTHAVLDLENDRLLLQDTSSNGTFINGSTEPVGRGNTDLLSSGDSLSIGDYSVSVSILEKSSNKAIHSDGSAENANPPVDDDPFDPFGGNEPDWPGPPVESIEGAEHNDLPFPDASKSAHVDPFGEFPDIASEEIAARATSNETTSETIGDEYDWLPSTTDETISNPTPIAHAGSAEIPSAPPTPQATQESHKLRRPDSMRHGDALHSENAVSTLLKSAGLNPADFVNADGEVLMGTVGMLLNHSVKGMMLLLNSRAEMKNAMRTDMTRLGSQNNNPIKFSTNVNKALTTLLANESRHEYLPPEDAIDEAISDLAAHHLAMLDGMKAAVKSLLFQFDPTILEEKLVSRNPIAANIPITREARLWQLFNERYNDIQEEAMHDFEELFGREFRRAYDKRIKVMERKPSS